MTREQMLELIASIIVNRSKFDDTAGKILDLVEEEVLRQAADDFEVAASLGGSVIERLRARADEIAQGIR